MFQKTGHARTLTWFGIALIALSVRFAYAMRIPQPESNQEAGSNGDTSWAYENLWEDDKYQGFGLLQLNKPIPAGKFTSIPLTAKSSHLIFHYKT